MARSLSDGIIPQGLAAVPHYLEKCFIYLTPLQLYYDVTD